ncbi:FKBP-type peptidyl-prolyl cis-trans isomerase [Parabacteroides sp. PF5-5]|uniref:FKBP-type peptidyl-prolyl cis-trans isomerase n=1 Tax=unclassified Parabacteroides TaxID=2649774 RepID=UPI0024758961|nr:MULTISPECIES: FKBP-type peptidyl-prolyl cis-trans isomerase [unclassified Parabacteroides]MDH6303446.1 FKBP-type peptidyl-prolyl cis-trans isomerase [Parabacteroides sp. PH5-39]MDH6314769.1 FKBP-type peptidyl-prolyl cis-trans isomerase [Parabacteroides sp. PF5-13]MDH6318106.1 FKBP-type peptidyl-prolyl cis-trans isomerase [Parabacteroides sp. PH5-13]MDH6321963.1 FKBP-type peptidyl-prolyl cis-trans isomerase [Parabacteroides sp. PH5-8]MDH6326086.1 FKBP-type peptidyl-prolyl cis-trans isomerase
MKKISVLVAVAVAAIGVSATSCDSKKNVTLKSDVDSASYALGVLNGDGFRQNLGTVPGEPIDVDLLLAAFEAGLKNDTSSYKMSVADAQNYIQTYFMQAQTKELNKVKEEGAKFLEENKTKSGVITTESGLQYQVITEGTGEKPTAESTVKVHYTGTLLDGTKFDSSFDHAGGEPAEFALNGVIKGWTEGIAIMPVGSKYIFWIPSDLAYGDRGAGQQIKPGSVLKFEVELLEIVK